MNRYETPPRGCGGMRTTAKDYATFMCKLIAVYNDSNNNQNSPGYNLAKEMFKWQKDCHDEYGEPYNYGLGIYVINKGGNVFFTHQGGTTSCAAEMRIYPLTGQGTVVIVNNVNHIPCWQILATIGREYRWSNMIGLETMILSPIQKNQFVKYIGKYKMPEKMLNIEVVIFEDNGELKLRLPWPKVGSDPIKFDFLEFKLLQEKDGTLAALGDKLGIKVVYYKPKNKELQKTIGISLSGPWHPPLIGTPISN